MTIVLKTHFLDTTRSGVIRCVTNAEHLGRSTQVFCLTVFGTREQG